MEQRDRPPAAHQPANAIRRGATTLDDHALVERCREGDLDACRELTARHASTALRVAYLLTGGGERALDLVRGALLALLLDLRRGGDIQDTGQRLLFDVGARWLALDIASGRTGAAPFEPLRGGADAGADEARAREALGWLDAHQRAALVLHDFGGLPLEQLAGLIDVPADLAHAQLVGTRAAFRRSTGFPDDQAARAALTAVSFRAPRQVLWPAIEDDVRAGFERQQRRQRALTFCATAALLAILLVGTLLVLGRSEESAAAPEPTAVLAAGEPVTPTAAFTVLPTSTATPSADVGDAVIVRSLQGGAPRTGLFNGGSAILPLLGETAVEEGAPLVSPDGEQVFLLWYDLRAGSATGYLAAWDSDLSAQQWQVTITVDGEVAPGEGPDVQLSAAVDHEHVYVARHGWRSGDNIEIDVRDRESGELLETIATNLPGFAASDVRLEAPPGLGRVHLLAITNDAPAESGALSITFLAYQVPGGEKVHGRILHDQPDSRTFFLYESQLIAGSATLFGVDYTAHYHHLAVHFFDLARGVVLPRLVLPFQPVADPLPYQQAVSHNGHWLYVLSPASREVAVVNLFDRSLAGIVPLDPGVLGAEPVGVHYLQGRDMQMSPDGGRLYALGTGAGGASGVWVIDTGSWTVVAHWLPGARPAEILLSGDGRTLYLRREAVGGPTSGAPLLAVDTASGDAQPIHLPDAGRFSLASIATLYRGTYAVSPAIAGQQPSVSPAPSPLAAAAVEVDASETPPGESITIAVRFVHPLTGEPVSEDGSGARFEKPSGVRVTWAHSGGAAPVILELGSAGYGHYEGFVRLPEVGAWTATVEIDWPSGGFPDRALASALTVTVLPGASASSPSAPGG